MIKGNLVPDFNYQFLQALPADPITENFTRQVTNACYSQAMPVKTNNPSLVSVSRDLAKQFTFSQSEQQSQWFVDLVSGNKMLPGMRPYALCYGGHQFGNWAGQLGDGRAINLGDLLDSDNQYHTFQLKGAGPTPYSRSADGLAVLRSSVREYLCSEAMHYLGVATTRALSLSLSGDNVMRDMFYDGHPALEKGAVVCRVAPSFIRFGSFQIHAARDEVDILKQLADYVIARNFPDLGAPCPDVYETWFETICESTITMVLNWMRVGFVHGVMNTDNMSILGQTIDYGPYGWLEGYDPDWTPNTTDAQGRRYSYGKQPKVAQWNLFQLANALYPLIGRVEKLEAALANFADSYQQQAQEMYADKLGLAKHLGEPDETLIEQLFQTLQLTETDMTIFFRRLATMEKSFEYSNQQLLALVEPAYYQFDSITAQHQDSIITWLGQYQQRIAKQSLSDEVRLENMNGVNPKYVLRNYLAQQAIDKADNGDYSEIELLMTILKKPYDEQPQYQEYAGKRPEWARQKAGCSMLSCSS
ncbi:MAG: hypothetical protein ACJA13_002991 [Paraglaciecola sp.]|jgi:uncharacterized protein YdiU (UPF0061 family)